jgi:proline dehydrogenase
MNFENTEVAFANRSNSELRKAHFLFSAMGNPFLTKIGIKFTQFAFNAHLPIKSLVKSTIFNHFCGGETLQEADKTAIQLNKYGISIIMYYGV